MKKSFLKKLIPILFFCTVICKVPRISAGGEFSKPASQIDVQQMYIIKQPKYYPHISPDGGKAYFGAWNGLKGGKNFEIFSQKYSGKIQNERSASTLKDSPRGEQWRTKPIYLNSCKIEDREAQYPGEYLLRVNYKDRIIYTIRKSADEYLCTFYILNIKSPSDIQAEVFYYLLLSSDSNVKQLLLPIDQELLK